jgi:hypothetical protein
LTNRLTTYYKKRTNTTLDAALLKRLKILAVEQDKQQNDLIEEALQDLLKKYQSDKQ